MMISVKMQDALNAQIGMEFAAAMKYDAMAAHFEAEALPQAAKRFFKQAGEEREHAHKFLRYVLAAGGRARLPEIPAPPHTYKSSEAAAQAALDSEMAVTKSINKIMDLAIGEKDHATVAMLQWFITEQVEEISSADQFLRLVQRAGEKNIFALEDYLADTANGD
ncbi:MAG: ferritin [Chthoniobacterales bacterium]|jgi:bacterioferritin B|nr:ferritin [Chthoniobacterales bacterium]